MVGWHLDRLASSSAAMEQAARRGQCKAVLGVSTLALLASTAAVSITASLEPGPSSTPVPLFFQISKGRTNNLRSLSTFCLVVVSQPRVQLGSHIARRFGWVVPSFPLLGAFDFPSPAVGINLNSVALQDNRRWGWIPSLAATEFRFFARQV